MLNPRYVVSLSLLLCAVFGNSFFNSTLPVQSRVIRVVPASGPIGGTVSVPIELVSQGDENAIGFSLTFNAAIFSNPQTALGADATGATLNVNANQAAQGRLGVALALPANQKFTAGARRILIVTFTISGNTTFGTSSMAFGDQPVLREVSDTNASALTVSFAASDITITKGFEADVTPRPDGNNDGTVTITDWVQIGRFVAGLDTPDPGNEYQRADCAPRVGLGDGRLSVTDWAQAGRYAAGLDPIIAAGGPTSPIGLPAIHSLQSTAYKQTETVIRNSQQRASVNGRSGNVDQQLLIEVDAQGTENSFGFSLSFNASRWHFVGASVGSDAREALLHINANQTGRVGLALALPAGRSLQPGVRQLITCTFSPVAAGNSAPLTVSFGDFPIQRELADAEANIVPASYASENSADELANLSAASFDGREFAPEQIVSAFGSYLATGTEAATTVLPTMLAGTKITITDSANTEHLAPLFFVSPQQINYVIPADVREGAATIAVINNGQVLSGGLIQIAAVAPGLFTANANGQGLAAGVALRVNPDGSQQFEPITQLDLGAKNEQVYLVLFGTGLRRASSLATVRVEIGGIESLVLYVGQQGDQQDQLMGLDQINLLLPPGLRGRGEVAVKLTVDGKPANVVKIYIK